MINKDIPERLIKIKIDREIDRAQYNALSELIDLSDFDRKIINV